MQINSRGGRFSLKDLEGLRTPDSVMGVQF